MSANVFPAASALVSRIVDYEPPTAGQAPALPSTIRRACLAVPPPQPPQEDRTQVRAAATFADAVLRRVLEVIDRRRPLTQLRPLLATGLVDSLLAGAPGGHAGDAARLRRVRAQLARPDGRAAEVAAHYTRGGRVGVIACRVEQVDTATGTRWQMVALHLG